MRIADTDFILIPEWLAGPDGSQFGQATPDDDHWISRWQRSITSARWLETQPTPPSDALSAQCAALDRPIIIVTHGRGVEVLLASSAKLTEAPVSGAFIVAPVLSDTAPATEPLPCPSVIVAPDNHPDLPPEAARHLAQGWGSHYVDAGTVGRLDALSGHGPWPEGLMRLGWFLKRLSAH